MKIKRIGENIHVAPLLWALHENPDLWDQHKGRTESTESPHHGLSDIWARYAPPGVDPSKRHDAIWYANADILPVRDIVYPLMAHLSGDILGGVLITKIPAGMQCKPHVDNGWHAKFYKKFAVQIQSSPGQRFCFEDEKLETKPGDLFYFDNSFTHWVENPTPHDRITMIVCIKTDIGV